jgi:hypothetical protein
VLSIIIKKWLYKWMHLLTIIRPQWTREAKITRGEAIDLVTHFDHNSGVAASGYQSTSGLLSVLKGFDSESEFVAWNEILTRVGTLRAVWIFEGSHCQRQGTRAWLGVLG